MFHDFLKTFPRGFQDLHTKKDKHKFDVLALSPCLGGRYSSNITPKLWTKMRHYTPPKTNMTHWKWGAPFKKRFGVWKLSFLRSSRPFCCWKPVQRHDHPRRLRRGPSPWHTMQELRTGFHSTRRRIHQKGKLGHLRFSWRKLIFPQSVDFLLTCLNFLSLGTWAHEPRKFLGNG